MSRRGRIELSSLARRYFNFGQGEKAVRFKAVTIN